jgi:catechol 2,3-dioxygenase-like lactoylglutathione lyase family enzyme
MSIAVVSVPVKDQDAAKSFYIDKLQFKLLVDQPMGPEMRWVQLQPKTGGSSIALTTWFESLRPGGQEGLVLHVGDVDAEHARLAGLGIEMRPLEDQPWGRFTMFEDPDGNGWILATLTEPQQFGAE